jgi:hypothetical protein
VGARPGARPWGAERHVFFRTTASSKPICGSSDGGRRSTRALAPTRGVETSFSPLVATCGMACLLLMRSCARSGRARRTIAMSKIACLPALALLAIGCASRPVPPAATATATPAQTGHATPPASHGADSQGVVLRPFYLLSPGPSSTLVVTRTDTAVGTR